MAKLKCGPVEPPLECIAKLTELWKKDDLVSWDAFFHAATVVRWVAYQLDKLEGEDADDDTPPVFGDIKTQAAVCQLHTAMNGFTPVDEQEACKGILEAIVIRIILRLVERMIDDGYFPEAITDFIQELFDRLFNRSDAPT